VINIAGFDAGLGGRSVGLRLRNQRAFSFFEAKAVGDIDVTG